MVAVALIGDRHRLALSWQAGDAVTFPHLHTFVEIGVSVSPNV